MDKLNTPVSLQFHDLRVPPESVNKPRGISWNEAAEKQIPDISTGYLIRVPKKTIADRLHLHRMTKTDYKQTAKKRMLFNQLIPSLMSATGMSQTSVLTHLLPALEITPYLRKMDRGEMVKVSDHPSQLQTGLLLELITRIKQGYKLQELQRLAGEQTTTAEITVNGQPQSLSIGLHHFTREDLGDETFRELRDRLLGQSDPEERPGVILDHVLKRKAVAMAHWQKILTMVLNTQDSATREQIANALNTDHGLSPATAVECEALTALIPTLKLTTHPGFSLMKPLYSWLSQHHLKGDKLSSQQLTWLHRMVTNRLYTHLPPLADTGLENLCIYKECLINHQETESPRNQLIQQAIDSATAQQLTEVIKLFDTLLCDLTPSVNAENRLGIIYTLLKFKGQTLLNNLLATSTIGRGALTAMYKTQLTLTYDLDEQASAEDKTVKEQSVNCLLKTLLLRMAWCLIILESKDGVAVPPEVINKARTLIDHHNEGLQAVLPEHELDQQDTDDNWDMLSCSDYSDASDDSRMPSANNGISAQNYLTLPDYLLTSGRAVTLDPQHLMLPQDKHLRIPSAKIESQSEERRSERNKRHEQKLREDFLLTPQSTDLTRPIDWKKMEVPITFLLAGNTQDKSQLSYVFQVFNTEVLPFIQQATKENTLEQETLNVIRDLLAIAEITGKPGLDLITGIQSQTSNQALRALSQHVATAVSGLPDNHSRKQLLELTALQLFAELDNPFRRLIKTLYIIQSRSHFLRFADTCNEFHNTYTSILKRQLATLIKKDWLQPDGLLGSRIRQSVKAAFKSNNRNCSYQQIMDSLLASIRPSNQPPDNYPHLIDQMHQEVETRMNQHGELSNLKQQTIYRPACQERLGNEIEVMIETASRLCQQFLPEEHGSSTIPMSYDIAGTDSDMAMSGQIGCTQVSTPPSKSYLYDQLKALIPLIGSWLSQIIDNCLITEEKAAKAGIDRLVQFANSTVYRPGQNEDEILSKIINLSDRFHCLQKQHRQWQASHEIASTHDQWLEIKNTLKALQHINHFPSPQELQGQINTVIFGPDTPALSREDQALLGTVAGLKTRYSEPGLVSRALHHPNIREFNRQPEQLSHRIAQRNSLWSDTDRALHNQYQLLTSTLHHLKTEPLYQTHEPELQKALKHVLEMHRGNMISLRSTQQHCDSHLVHSNTELPDQSLLATLESMAWGHTAKYSGIETKPLSEQQKQQLAGLIESTSAESTLSYGASLFDWIGMGKNRQQHKAAASDPVPMLIDSPMSCEPVLKTIENINKENTKQIGQLKQDIDNENKTLAEIAKGHNQRTRELQEYKETLFGLLDDRMHYEIMIDGQAYSYADALIAFKNKDNYCNDDVSSTQRYLNSKLRCARHDHERKHEIYQNDRQWLDFARECRSHHTNPDILPQVIDLMVLESQVKIDDVENQIVRLQQRIQTAEQTIAENSALVKTEAAKLEASLKPELDAQRKKTRVAQLALFSKAFEHGQYLSEFRAMQRVLCQYLRQDMAAGIVEARIIEDCAAQKKHVPSNYREIIEPPVPGADESHCRWRSMSDLPFQIINVPGAFPLLESLLKERRIYPGQLLTLDDQGKPSSALVFAAAEGRWRACEALIKYLEETRYLDLDTFNRLLTVSPCDDNRNLLHHLAQLAKPTTLKALLQLLNNVSKKQIFDADYASDCLQNRIALDKEHLLKTLLAQTDYEGHHPTDLLLFNIAKRIREWPEDNDQALTSYANDFLINEAKNMWITVSESMGVEQFCQSVECFMKGIDDLGQLSPAKQQAAEDFLKQLMRIFRVHGPAGLHEQLMAQIRVGQTIGMSDQHSFLSGSV